MIFIYLMGVFVGAIDNGIVNPALSSIGEYFSINDNWTVWSFTIFTLAYAITVPIAGKLADDYGGSMISFIGVSIFIAGTLISVFTSHYIIFLIGRVMQGVGGGTLIPIANAELIKIYGVKNRGKALGAVSGVYAFSMVIGPFIGGIIIKYLFWKWIFYIILPILLFMWFSLIKEVKLVSIRKLNVDIKGVVFLSLSILSIMLSITMLNYYYLMVGLILLTFFTIIELNQRNPLINVKLVKNKNYAFALIISFLVGIMWCIPLLISLIGEMRFSIASGNSAFLLIPMSIFGIISSFIGGNIVDKIGAKKSLLFGFMIVFFSSTLLLVTRENIVLFILYSLIFGFSGGFVIGSPLKALIVELSPENLSNSSISLVSLFRSIGTSVGGVYTGFLFAYSDQGVDWLFISILSFCLICILLNVFINTEKKVEIGTMEKTS